MVDVIVFLFALAANVGVLLAFGAAIYLAIGNVTDNQEFAAASFGAAVLLFIVMQFITAGAIVLAILGWIIGGIVHGFGYVVIIAVVAAVLFFLTKASERSGNEE